MYVLDVLSTVTNIKAGDLVTWNNSAGKLTAADADSLATYASFIAMHSGDGGGQNTKVAVTRRCKLIDSDAPWTIEDGLYLSTTALGITATRPTAAPDLVQRVGTVVKTDEAEIDIRVPYEVYVPIVVKYATSANALLDSGNHGGPTLDAQNEVAVLDFTVPENAIALEIAHLWVAAEDTAGTPTMDITIGSAIDGAQHDVVTADATLVDQVREGAAADEMHKINITTGLDATDIIRPGALVGIKCTQDDAGTDSSHVFGGYAVFTCV